MQLVLLSVIVIPDRADAEEQLATQVGTLVRLMLPVKAAARAGGPVAGPDRSALLLLAPLLAGPQRPGALADLCHADPSTVSGLVAARPRRGLVRREADPSDGRASLLAITDAGREACERVRARRRQLFAAAVRDWTDDELATLAGLLARFTDALGTAYCPPAHTQHPAAPAHPEHRDQDIA